MVKEVKIEQAEDGYIINRLDFSGNKKVVKSFSQLILFLKDYFDEGKRKKESNEEGKNNER
jgi:hypothetical protein